MQKIIIHFERSPPEGDCYRRAIEVEVRKGSQSKESCVGGQKKEAAGSYRSRSLEKVPVERELREVEEEEEGGKEGRKEEWGRRRNLITPLYIPYTDQMAIGVK